MFENADTHMRGGDWYIRIDDLVADCEKVFDQSMGTEAGVTLSVIAESLRHARRNAQRVHDAL